MTAALSLLPSPPPSLGLERCYCCNQRTETRTEERRTSTETAEGADTNELEPRKEKQVRVSTLDSPVGRSH